MLLLTVALQSPWGDFVHELRIRSGRNHRLFTKLIGFREGSFGTVLQCLLRDSSGHAWVCFQRLLRGLKSQIGVVIQWLFRNAKEAGEDGTAGFPARLPARVQVWERRCVWQVLDPSPVSEFPI